MEFYYTDISPFCQSVMLTAKALGINLNKIKIDIMSKDHLKQEFLSLNPQHCVPTLVDGELNLWESRAICSYLVNQYGKDDSLYPKDPKKRVLVDKLLYFDLGTFSERCVTYFFPVMFEISGPDSSKLERVYEALGWLNGFLDGHDFCVGNQITIADHVLIAMVSSIIEADLVDITKYLNIQQWVYKCKIQMVGYETENEKGAKMFADFVKPKFEPFK